MPLTEPAHLALLGTAVSDAFGCPFEYHASAPAFARLSISEGRYLQGYEDCKLPIRRCRTTGLYSDDTQQALILLWIWGQVLSRNRDPHDANVIAGLFLQVCRKMAQSSTFMAGSFGVHRGTGKNFRDAILTGVAPDTAGLGGAMRIGPVATLLPDPAMVVPWTVTVTSTTTCNPVALAGAAMVAAKAWELSHEGASCPGPAPGPVADAWTLLLRARDVLDARGEEALLAFATKSGTAERVLRCAADGFALTGIPWILHHVDGATTFSEALVAACSSGGDADTVSAITGCLCALKLGRDSIPAWMVQGLVGLNHVLDPSTWHPVQTEAAYVRLDQQLQRLLEEKELLKRS